LGDCDIDVGNIGWRSKFPNPDGGQKSVIRSVTENVWPPCPAPARPAPYPALQDRQTNGQTPPL